MTSDLAIFQTDQGAIALKPDFASDTLWITQRQLAEVFAVDLRTINEHIKNIFKSGELDEVSAIRKFRITAADGKSYNTNHYNLDMAISVGYRVNSAQATKFRKWATGVLRTHISDGITIDPTRLAHRQHAIQKALTDLQHLSRHSALNTDQALEIVQSFAQTWLTLDRFDRGTLTAAPQGTTAQLDSQALSEAIATLRAELIRKGEASALFATEKSEGALAGIAGNVMQAAFGEALYPSLEEKAAHLLYFMIKNHPFNDGNKRSGAFAFVWFLRQNAFDTGQFSEPALAALTLLIATSDPAEKPRMIGLILEFLSYE